MSCTVLSDFFFVFTIEDYGHYCFVGISGRTTATGCWK